MCPIDCHPREVRTVDRVLDALRDSLRREVVYYFETFTSESTATLDELVAHVQRRIPDKDGEEVSTLLVHVHIPKLETMGWLEFERRSETVRYYGHDAAEQLLRRIADAFA